MNGLDLFRKGTIEELTSFSHSIKQALDTKVKEVSEKYNFDFIKDRPFTSKKPNVKRTQRYIWTRANAMNKAKSKKAPSQVQKCTTRKKVARKLPAIRKKRSTE